MFNCGDMANDHMDEWERLVGGVGHPRSHLTDDI